MSFIKYVAPIAIVALLFSANQVLAANAMPSDSERQSACMAITGNAKCAVAAKASSGVIDTLKLACAAKLKEAGCDELRAEITKNDSPEAANAKLRSCDGKSVCGPELNWEAMGDKCVEGMKRFGKEATEKLKKAWDAIAAGDQVKCDGDLLQKMQMYARYNETVPDLLKFHPPKSGALRGMTCGEIRKQIFAKHANLVSIYDSRLNQLIQRDAFARNNPSRIKDANLRAYNEWLQANGAKQSTEMNEKIEAFKKGFKAVPGLMKSFNVRVDCYTPEVKSELACYAGTIAVKTVVGAVVGNAANEAALLLAEASGSVKVATALKAVRDLEKTNEKLANVAEGTRKAERLTDLAAKQQQKVLKAMDAMKGAKGDEQRKQLVRAMDLLKDEDPVVQDRMLQAIVDAHNVCAESGFKTATSPGYSPDCLRKKAKIMKAAGLSQSQRDTLMRLGIAGKFEDIPEKAVEVIRKSSKYLFGRELYADQVQAIYEVTAMKDRAEKVKLLTATGFSKDEIDKIISGELINSREKAKNMTIADKIQERPITDAATSTQAAAPAQATAPASAQPAAMSPTQKLADSFERQNGDGIQKAFEESRQAHAEELKKNPTVYENSPSKVIEGVTTGLTKEDSAKFIESYVAKRGGNTDAEFKKMMDAIDNKALAEAGRNPIQSSYNQFKLQELKVELLERYYTKKYNSFNQLDTDKFYDADEAGFEAFSAAREKLEALKKKGEKLKWPK